MPFVGGDPFDGDNALFALRGAFGFPGCHGEPGGLLEVPFAWGRVGAFEPGFGGVEEVVGLDCFSA